MEPNAAVRIHNNLIYQDEKEPQNLWIIVNCELVESRQVGSNGKQPTLPDYYEHSNHSLSPSACTVQHSHRWKDWNTL